MPWFRAANRSSRIEPTCLARIVADLVRPENFWASPACRLEWEHHDAETVPWQVFQGRLLEPAHCSERAIFESWSVYRVTAEGRSSEPIVSVKHDKRGRFVHGVRAVYCHAWEGYHAGDNVYLSRESRKWLRELVGTIALDRFADAGELKDEILCLLFQAVIGASRLPLTSVEAPLPAFSLGEMAYFYEAASKGGVQADWSWLEKVKFLEFQVRSLSKQQIQAAAATWLSRWPQLGHSKADFLALCRTLFQEISLSPYTDFVEKFFEFLGHCVAAGFLAAEDRVDFIGWLLRHVCRHLTAYDLFTFHHRGANYPDALLLDWCLKEFLGAMEERPEWFVATDGDSALEPTRKGRRRALRQAWMLRRFYEGWLVPDVPTSPGENSRVLPAPHVRVPEDQILYPIKRTKKLYDNDPLPKHLGPRGQEILLQSIRDLADSQELQELGMAVYLDRPLGAGKPPTEPDRTPLLSYETFSRSVAERRLRYLTEELGLLPDSAAREAIWHKLRTLAVTSIRIEPSAESLRPGSVSLQDARKIADDWQLLRTTQKSAGDFLSLFDFDSLAQSGAADFLQPNRRLLIVGAEGTIRILDAALKPRLELQIDASQGYASRAGIEFPRAGLRLQHAWHHDGTQQAPCSIPIPIKS